MWFGPKNAVWIVPIFVFNGMNISGIWFNNLAAQERHYAHNKRDGSEVGGH